MTMNDRHRRHLFGLLLPFFALCLSACARDEDPDAYALYDRICSWNWEVETLTRGTTDLNAEIQHYTFDFLRLEESLVAERQFDIDSIVGVNGEFQTYHEAGKTWLRMAFASPSVCDSLAGDWQALRISRRKVDLARTHPRTGELERLQFGR